MAKTTVYSAFEVRDGFGPNEVGELDLRTESRTDAEARVEDRWTHGSCVQLFGIRSHDSGGETRVLLRSLVALKAA
jgi:hypothetical protein